MLIGNLTAHAQPLKPEGCRMDNYRAPTLTTVRGGFVLNTVSAHELWTPGNAVLDRRASSAAAAGKPAGVGIMYPVLQRDIPSSLWLPDTAAARSAPRA
jgi:hypothetical protein